MDINGTEEALRALETDLGADLIYPLLRAYGFPKTSITRLRNGGLNVAARDGELLWKNRVWFRHVDDGSDVHLAIDDAQRDAAIKAKKPRFLIVTDTERLVAVDTRKSQTLDIPLHELASNVAFFWAWTGVERTPMVVANRAADVKAAQRMAKLYDEVRSLNQVETDSQIEALNGFFCRLLFCFFAEDTGIFRKGSFTDLINDLTQSDGSDTQALISQLFEILAMPLDDRKNTPAHLADFGYVNGDLFAGGDVDVPQFSARARGIIIESSQLDWAKINPDIFGSMMQAVVRTDDREALGMHYTSEENILKVLNPLFLDELNEAFDGASDSTTKLDKLRKRLADIKVFDPACGSGNFLVVAYKELRKLEHRILQRRYDLEGYEAGALFAQESVISLDNFYGIEIDEFAVAVARLSLWLAKHQMNLEFQELFEVEVSLIPLTDAGDIVCANATRIDWNSVCPASETDEVYVCGNPPYLGGTRQEMQHKDDLRYAFGESAVNMYLDYLAIWFLRAAQFVAGRNAEAGLVGTNSICQGNQVALLWPYLLGLRTEISFAVGSFRWSNNAQGNAGVTCVVVGLSAKGKRKNKTFLTETQKRIATQINPYLVPDGPTVIVVQTKRPISGLVAMTFGSMPRDGGALILDRDERDRMIAEYPAVKKLIKEFVGAEELMKGAPRFCLWIDDVALPEALQIPPVAQRLEQVRNMRAVSRAVSTQKFADQPHRFVQLAYKPTNAIIVPIHTSERREYVPIGFVGPETVISNAANAIYDAEPWLFGLIQSRMHMAWTRAVAGRLKTDIRYSATLVYNTFPVPELTNTHRADLTKAARHVLRVREHFYDQTLAQMYDPEKMTGGLRQAHRNLDEVVDHIYRPAGFGSDEDRLSLLFDMYVEQSAHA